MEESGLVYINQSKKNSNDYELETFLFVYGALFSLG